MKKVLFLSMGLLCVMLDTSAFGAAPARRGRTTSGTSTAVAAPKTTAARAAVNSRSGGTKTTTASAPKVTSARAAVKNTTAAPKAPTVAARAATTQKVIGGGTKVATAKKNTVVNEECQAKYEGCMDSFCMLDNDNGGRCICSNRSLELDAVLAEIEKLDEQSYQMATLGVEKLEMGADADEAIKAANSVAQSLREGGEPNKKARRALDLSAWDITEEDEEDSIFGALSIDPNSMEGKEGDALHSAAMNLCKAQIPECAKDMQMLQMLYSQRIKSDCTAYENSLKQKKTQSSQKLQAAERALRETALEQYQNANKYDLGQCTIKFKECMQTTAGCGDDFSKCASVVAFDSTNVRQSSSKKTKNYQIKGAVSNIEISASTYDALMAKKPMCDTVTKQCTRVAGQVWDTFLREVAPQLKSAEIIAEDNARQDCIGNISSCFQKACKDNMDPNDPDGSYDMCLSRPEAMLNVCKIPLNACGIDASSAKQAKESIIWDFVTARLAAMRVDACTNEVKECMQADDVCGKDYLNCIGLDTYTIINMCHRDKLTACYSSEYGADDQAREDYIYSVAQGLILNIDNEMLAQCQEAANKAMIKVCGDTESCDNMTIADGVGANALEYKVCEYASLDSVNVMGADGQSIAVPGFDNGYVFHNCKQNIGLILDEELLGEVVYDTKTRPESLLGINAEIDESILSHLNRIYDFTDLAVKNSYKVGELTNQGDNLGDLFISAANNSVKGARIKYTNNEIKRMNNQLEANIETLFDLRSKKQSIRQQTIEYQVRNYSGVKQFMGVIDGVVAWNQIDILLGDMCPAIDTGDKTAISKNSNTIQLNGAGAGRLCISGIDDAVFTSNLGQNSTAKQDQILSDLGALRNSINNTIYAIESDPTVQFCMTGRKVQGLKMGKDGAQERSEARFPNLTDSMKAIIAQSAIRKAQDNYNKRYNELDDQLRKDNVALAERIIKVRQERDAADRAEISARACLNLGANSALPVTTDTDLASLQSGQGYTATSKNDDPYYRETVTTTFSPTTLICKKCTVRQNCETRGGYKDCCYVDSRHCKKWFDPVETCEETQF